MILLKLAGSNPTDLKPVKEGILQRNKHQQELLRKALVFTINKFLLNVNFNVQAINTQKTMEERQMTRYLNVKQDIQASNWYKCHTKHVRGTKAREQRTEGSNSKIRPYTKKNRKQMMTIFFKQVGKKVLMVYTNCVQTLKVKQF